MPIPVPRHLAQAIVDRLNSDPRIAELNAMPEEACSPGATMAAAGVPYTLAGRDVPPPSDMHIVALSLIHSPLLTMDDEELPPMDAWRALWAITCGPHDLAPLLGLDGRIDSMPRIREKTGVPAEAAARMCDQAAAAAWQGIDAAVLDMAGRYPGARPQEIADLIGRMLTDVATAWELAPRGPDSKKNCPAQRSSPPSTGIGWRDICTWPLRLACRLGRICFGACRRRSSGWSSATTSTACNGIPRYAGTSPSAEPSTPDVTTS